MLDIKIGIDPGHGGRDPGAVGLNGLKEKDVTFGISVKLSKLLQSKGLKTVLTRNSDTHLGTTDKQDLSARTNLLNNAKCDYAISIHCDASVNRNANYFSIYVIGLGGEAEKLAKAIIPEIQTATGWNWGADDDGVREKNLHMIRETKMPSILIECGFISNLEQEALLRQSDFQQLLAEAIYKGMLNYLGIKEEKPVVEQWKLDIMKNAAKAGLIDGNHGHNPDDRADKWFVLAVMLNMLNQLKK